jgi:hypothetical protein
MLMIINLLYGEKLSKKVDKKRPSTNISFEAVAEAKL